jgi:hypothetical protein
MEPELLVAEVLLATFITSSPFGLQHGIKNQVFVFSIDPW